MGTGLATLVVSLTGVAGLSGDLQAAARDHQSTTPVLSPGEELRDTTRSRGLVIQDACAKIKHEHGLKSSNDAPRAIPTPPATTPTTGASTAREF